MKFHLHTSTVDTGSPSAFCRSSIELRTVVPIGLNLQKKTSEPKNPPWAMDFMGG